MATSAASVRAGERDVRVTSPDRVIYEATDAGPAITKHQVCEYFSAVGPAMMRAIGDRPTAMERWPDGYRDGMRLATGPQDKGGDGFYQKRLPKGAPDWIETVDITFPSRRTAAELCPSEPASVVWAAQMGTLTFHPWPVRRPEVDRPDELRLDLDPQPGTTFADAQRVAEVTRELLAELGLRGYPKTSGNRGIHVYVRIRPEYTFEDVRHAAIGLGRELERRDDGVTTAWWKEERGKRIFLDYNQNNRDRTIASAWSLRARPGAPVSTPMTWATLAETTDPRAYTLHTVPDYLADGDPWADMDDEAFSLDPLLQLWETLPGGELNFPPDYPKMPGEPPRVQPSKKVAEHWDDEGNRVPDHR
ncbi:DNA polymerase domain-containing protein [Rhodococcoides corynebacterioides]|uniref:DNA polymerase domain-containing protein n=1 Tax=Rhodococcoides corynebacterioides TaxID=53972 RepID=A0ABS7P5K8_9NOCA|nr:DNA polymerase domain-containing protein [Rhodococcus corynebacterioides]MBY6367710.1 DNA polymerase domain-containing protein [Rhodococcus corynebacterioides]MBY6408531.1 DNA polymerase domain-containing protein [Rhodococcus corynebacterioides]